MSTHHNLNSPETTFLLDIASNSIPKGVDASTTNADSGMHACIADRCTQAMDAVKVKPLPTPVLLNPLTSLLKDYGDKRYIVCGFAEGFYLEYSGKDKSLNCKNSKSVNENLTMVKTKIDSEITQGRISGPFSDAPFLHFKCSPLAVREKKETGKFRLLHNLSYPYNEDSVNFNILESDSKVKYAKLEDAVQIIQLFPVAYMAKTDIAEAFRIIPLHPSQYKLTGFHFKNEYYFDKCLPMGCSSSCKIFERFSDCLIWILEHHFKIVHVVKVLDDFLFIAPSFKECQKSLNFFLCLCKTIGVPIAYHKTVGPSTCLSFLGIELDSVNMVARLPVDKLTEYKNTIQNLLLSPSCTLKDMKSILGKLQFATSVVSSGRPFLRRMYDTTIGLKKSYSKIKLVNNIKADLEIWYKFLQSYNGVTILSQKTLKSSIKLHLFTDSSKFGYGAVFGTHYLYGSFPPAWHKLDIQVLELYPIFILVNLFANKFKNQSIGFHCDNSSVVSAINKQTSKNKDLMRLLRPMVLILLNNNINFCSYHIPGKQNILCDHLSRNQVTPALLEAYGMDRYPTTVPQHLLPHNLKFK